MYIIHLLIRHSTVAQCNGNFEAICPIQIILTRPMSRYLLYFPRTELKRTRVSSRSLQAVCIAPV